MTDCDSLLTDHPRYAHVKYLNRGSYGCVTQATDKHTGDTVAIKFIERGSKITKYVEREILNHRRLRHPHVIELKEVFLTDTHLALVMEYAAGGDLFQLISHRKGVGEDEARWYFQQIMFAIDYCHKMGVASRDIKLENVLLLEKRPGALLKLADFGFSKDETCQSAAGTRVGTPAYLAPEVISNTIGQSYQAKKADVWSCGVLLYVMVTGRYPFKSWEDAHKPAGHKMHSMMQRIMAGQFEFPSGVQLSDSCKHLICNMLMADPSKRLAVEGVLLHPWCCQGLTSDVLNFDHNLLQQSAATQEAQQISEAVRLIVGEAAKESTAQRAQHAQQEDGKWGHMAHSEQEDNSSGERLNNDILEGLDDAFDF